MNRFGCSTCATRYRHRRPVRYRTRSEPPGTPAANAASLGVEIEVADGPAVDVAIDADRLTLVLVNLIENAVKHGRPGGVVFVGVDVSDRRYVRITVDDDGPGIAGADRERVFALGGRAATSAKGSGIGLAFVRLILDRAGGRVELEDSPLGGARFSISLPALRASAD